MHVEDSRVGLTGAQEKRRQIVLDTLYSIPSVRRNISMTDGVDDEDMPKVYKGWIEAGFSQGHAANMLLHLQERMLASTPWGDKNMTPEVCDWWLKRGKWTKSVSDDSVMYYSTPCIGNETGLSWEKRNRGGSVKEASQGSSGPYTSAPVRRGSDRRKDGSMSSTREKELDREFLHGDEDSLEDALIKQQSMRLRLGRLHPLR